MSYPNWDLWNDVPTMYADCTTVEQRLKHRIRRAAEKCDDFGLNNYDQAEMTFDKLLDMTEIRALLKL